MACEPQSATLGCVGDDAFNMRKEDGGGPDEATNVVIEHIPGAQSTTSLRCNRLALLCGPRMHLLRQGLRMVPGVPSAAAEQEVVPRQEAQEPSRASREDATQEAHDR